MGDTSGKESLKGLKKAPLPDYRTYKDVPIPMRDGLKIAANIYMPASDGIYPVLLSFTGFSKDRYWNDEFRGFRLTSYEPWSATNVPNSCTFEACDPAFWCNCGYVVVICDPRGFNRTPGTRALAEVDGPPGEQAILAEGRWARDQYDAVEWLAAQEWCNGNVGMTGVSILGFSQWRAAAMAPPHLKCFDPWEGMTDFYRDCKFPGGIPETKFTRPGHLKTATAETAWNAPENEDPPKAEYMTEDEWLKKITIPALICGNWMDHGCHTRGSFKAFRTISSKEKWLYTHGRSKWAVFYTSEARTVRKMFFDHYLKGTDDRILSVPRVQLCVMENMEKYTMSYEPDYPIASAVPSKLYLDAKTGSLSGEPVPKGEITYEPYTESAKFDYTFSQDTEMIGPSALKLWVSTSEGNDMDFFVTVRKFDVNGNEVKFDSPNIAKDWTVALGWLRASYRELDENISTPLEPYLKQVVGEGSKFAPGETIECQIPVLPTGVLFRKGEKLRIEINGKFRNGDKLENHMYFYDESVNQGKHTIYTGEDKGSYFLAPFRKK